MKHLFTIFCFLSAFICFAQRRDHCDTLHPQYYLLAEQLDIYGLIAAKGGWPVLPYFRPALKQGSVGQHVALLRRRLQAEHYLADLPVLRPDSFDHSLTLALLSFQFHNGLRATALADSVTIKRLNVSALARVTQIRLNMERWKCLPLDPGQRYVLINAADFRLTLIASGHEEMHMKIIIGRYYRKTPLFHAVITHVIFNPTWTVPDRILKKDILPQLVKDTGYLSKNRMRLYMKNSEEEIHITPHSRDSLTSRKFPYRIVQDAGPDNSLGLIKFEMPNPYHVYLHDTPAKKLFRAERPTFSSGCIRLSNAFLLARELLKEQGWDSLSMTATIQKGKTFFLKLKNPVPVYVDYFTAWVNSQGELEFRDDFYNRDREQELNQK